MLLKRVDQKLLGHVALALAAAGVLVGAMIAFLPNRTADSIGDRRTLNRFVLQEIAQYPLGRGTEMVRGKEAADSMGVTRDIVYQGQRLATGERNRAHCIGLAFEVWFHSYGRACREMGQDARILDGTVRGFWRLQRMFYGADGNKKTLVNALASSQLGVEIPLEEAQPGDFLQFWRKSARPSGHSGIVTGLLGDKETGVYGFRLWSITTADGISEREFEFMRDHVDRAETYVVRGTY